MIMPHNHRPPPPALAVAKAKRRAFPAKKRKEYAESAYLVYETDCAMWRTLSAHANEAGEVQFDLRVYVAYDQSDIELFSDCFEPGDASTFTEHSLAAHATLAGGTQVSPTSSNRARWIALNAHAS